MDRFGAAKKNPLGMEKEFGRRTKGSDGGRASAAVTC
jgi:hypothetical protein